MTTAQPAPPTTLISLSETCRRVARSRWWVRAEINANRFPKPITLAGRQVVFVEHEVEAWVAARIAERDRAA